MSDMKENLELLSRSLYRLPVAELTDEQLHAVVARAVLARLQPAWQGSLQAHCAGRRAYYFSAEYLLGKAVYNNLLCTGLTGEVEAALTACGRKLDQLDCVPDPPLGNGGLGRLAACFLDSGATLNLPLDGYGLRYRCGLFRQQIEDGFQVETVEDDLQYGDPWSVCCRADTVTVEFADFAVQAVPYDLPIPGYGTAHISTLRLWESVPIEPFDFDAFNRQDYTAAVTRRTAAENLTRVLYPNDTKEDGKRLRLRQQYFLCSASLQDLLRRYLRTPGSAPEKLGTAVVIQLNDTHPVLAIPEFIRLLLKQGLTLKTALGVANEVFCYTNHTVMPEAMESWDLALLASELPEIARLLCQLDDLFCAEMRAMGAEERLWHRVRPLRDGRIYMADLACWVCGYVNGVAALHTEILRRRVLRDWAQLYPDKILNRTNGITQRRFLALCNPSLSALLTHRLGSKNWITNLFQLEKLKPYADNGEVLAAFCETKKENKRRLARWMEGQGLHYDPARMLDVQIKRLHEYKRQLLHCLGILALAFQIEQEEITEFAPTTFLFAAKAAPGYARAKAIIKLIHAVGDYVARSPKAAPLLQVLFVPDYSVTAAERIIPAADVSEQISTAGTEASGTGNMKLMLNGAVTLGTYDGANVEIVAAAGEENNYIFGARVEDLDALRRGYDPKALYRSDPLLRQCLDALTDGTLSDRGTGCFADLKRSLLEPEADGVADRYFVLGDFQSYVHAKLQVNGDYLRSPTAFARKCWLNMCSAGVFSADRTIEEYANEIWRIDPVELPEYAENE